MTFLKHCCLFGLCFAVVMGTAACSDSDDAPAMSDAGSDSNTTLDSQIDSPDKDSSQGAGGAGEGGAAGQGASSQGGAAGQGASNQGGDSGAGGAGEGGDSGAGGAGEGGGGPAPFTPCTEVAHIGDSLSAPPVSAILKSAYESRGVAATVDAYGSRSVLNKVDADPHTGKEAAEQIKASGFTGCWVIALGTNDAASSGGSAAYAKKSIDAMMNAIDPGKAARVMWVNTYTKTGRNVDQAMRKWNAALVEAQSRWENLKIYDWATVAATGVAPFGKDGIHHTHQGYQVRSNKIAEALVTEGVGP